MSALVYSEPYKLPAGVLTLAVHGLFFAMLYLGVNWHEQPPQGMVVDLWDSLPEADSAAAQSVPPQKVESPSPSKAEKPVPQVKADIDLAEKKKKPEVKAEPKERQTKVEQRRSLAEMEALGKQLELAEQKDQARRAAQAAAGAAAIADEVGKYKGLISSKIRHNIVNPPDVADDAVAEFVVTLLPGGDVLDVKLRKSSGNAAYDDVVERAIRKAEPLPLPPGEAALKQFINPNQLHLKFSPKDKE